jgi:hypothetical protein
VPASNCRPHLTGVVAMLIVIAAKLWSAQAIEGSAGREDGSVPHAAESFVHLTRFHASMFWRRTWPPATRLVVLESTDLTYQRHWERTWWIALSCAYR